MMRYVSNLTEQLGRIGCMCMYGWVGVCGVGTVLTENVWRAYRISIVSFRTETHTEMKVIT